MFLKCTIFELQIAFIKCIISVKKIGLFKVASYDDIEYITIRVIEYLSITLNYFLPYGFNFVNIISIILNGMDTKMK